MLDQKCLMVPFQKLKLYYNFSILLSNLGLKVSVECDSSYATDVFAEQTPNENHSEITDERKDGDQDSFSDQEESVEPEDMELVRRQILDPTKQQKLRKGFRMASICWDD